MQVNSGYSKSVNSEPFPKNEQVIIKMIFELKAIIGSTYMSNSFQNLNSIEYIENLLQV